MLFRGTVYQAGYIVLTPYLDGRITDIVRGTHFLTTNQHVHAHLGKFIPGVIWTASWTSSRLDVIAYVGANYRTPWILTEWLYSPTYGTVFRSRGRIGKYKLREGKNPLKRARSMGVVLPSRAQSLITVFTAGWEEKRNTILSLSRPNSTRRYFSDIRICSCSCSSSFVLFHVE